ncbi:GNAT family N-acetyltransferase [Rossellomorea sp. YZS02]|uniref:GNAT family N-acetyltransferase n=1 Tax=Rossellomorea sp. YZS02 TaxID=3097358 RepID=UPI002A0C1D67|nr:GNAT family N-acetyltransferase [Rossellomorea sp. YZS02]MDX8342199.1 GNAT family N-acetyltransferase [Rossellomorea sp. YZS02]
MNEQVQALNKHIDLEDGLQLVYQPPKEFVLYHSIYHGQKYADYYFRRSPETLIELASIFDCGYFIMKDETTIGGVFLKPNFMSDLFVVPPYNDYEGLVQKLLNYLKKVSNTEEKITIREVVEEQVPTYEEYGCQINEVNDWMIRPTEPLKAILPEGYLSKPVSREGIEDIASLLVKAYKANPAYNQIGTKEDYIPHVKEFLDDHKNNKIMDECSRVIVDQSTNHIVGVCLHMEFEEYPLIMSLVVDPEHQHKGIGRYLLTHSINVSGKEYPATRLSVLKENHAIKLYENLGFIRNRSLTDMYL